MICTHQRPANSTAMPMSTPHVTARRCGSFFFSWSKTIMRFAISLLPPFDFPVRPEARLGHRAIAQGLSQPVEKAEPQRRDRAAGGARDQPLPERKPADERLDVGVDQQQQFEQ